MATIVEFALFPVYAAQAVYARWRTPRLPEPQGARSGHLGAGSPLRLLVVGDSSAAGVGVTTQTDALTGQLTWLLAERFSVSWCLLAKTGFTTTDVINLLGKHDSAHFDVVLVAVGANDLTQRVPAARWVKSLNQLVGVLTERFGASRIFLSPLPPMKEFPALPRPLSGYVGRRAEEYNVALRAFAMERENCEFLADAFPFGPEVLARDVMSSDGFHPGPPVYAAWAKCAASAIVALSGDAGWSRAETDAAGRVGLPRDDPRA
ncbi:SGNH/GDSL hydrolase family protein [Stigmatella sp. ncwal1]|uniref:SGNH/GDSL hydrolase family protein n=1 Tax=Stigmatella ashevillensis TaxID=2995309 RepID=A0ABT5DJV7_9BACT|nr:SGNH/GDSL hydrolase family protein [Stigmatella ashevillena]MDC0713811.1 SGNH/GDSL hydrolase family protein [Stigmatella ashevillena]